MHRWTLTTIARLFISGWVPFKTNGRLRSSDSGRSIREVAEDVQHEFGGLRIRHKDGALTFLSTLFNECHPDHPDAVAVATILATAAKDLHRELTPIGILDGVDEDWVVIDQHLQVYFLTNRGGEWDLDLFAVSFAMAIEFFCGGASGSELQDSKKGLSSCECHHSYRYASSL